VWGAVGRRRGFCEHQEIVQRLVAIRSSFMRGCVTSSNAIRVFGETSRWTHSAHLHFSGVALFVLVLRKMRWPRATASSAVQLHGILTVFIS